MICYGPCCKHWQCEYFQSSQQATACAEWIFCWQISAFVQHWAKTKGKRHYKASMYYSTSSSLHPSLARSSAFLPFWSRPASLHFLLNSSVVNAGLTLIVACFWFFRTTRTAPMWNLALVEVRDLYNVDVTSWLISIEQISQGIFTFHTSSALKNHTCSQTRESS